MYKTVVSLHAFEANGMTGLQGYLDPVLSFAAEAADRGVRVGLRLWNGGGASRQNGEILAAVEKAFPPPYRTAGGGKKLRENVWLEAGERFDWPDPGNEPDAPRFCMGLRDQAAVLCDGTVTPCCMDADGGVPLGNLFTDTLEEILASPRATALRDGFSRGEATEDLCRRCPFAKKKFG